MQRKPLVAAILIGAVVGAVALGGATAAAASSDVPTNRGWDTSNRGWDTTRPAELGPPPR